MNPYHLYQHIPNGWAELRPSERVAVALAVCADHVRARVAQMSEDQIGRRRMLEFVADCDDWMRGEGRNLLGRWQMHSCACGLGAVPWGGLAAWTLAYRRKYPDAALTFEPADRASLAIYECFALCYPDLPVSTADRNEWQNHVTGTFRHLRREGAIGADAANLMSFE